MYAEKIGYVKFILYTIYIYTAAFFDKNEDIIEKWKKHGSVLNNYTLPNNVGKISQTTAESSNLLQPA